jgi:HPt (histidine-containing phosphotransfer) domain-containing protein
MMSVLITAQIEQQEEIMANIPGNTEWIAQFIPGLEARKEMFVVDTDEVDDELVEVFIDEILRLTADLQDGLKQHKAEIIRGAAHSIKGMGGTLGLPEISVLALEIENRAKEGLLDEARPMVDSLADWTATLR